MLDLNIILRVAKKICGMDASLMKWMKGLENKYGWLKKYADERLFYDIRKEHIEG